jgi:[acyl-carrier-protein] S-malonyltransferase
MKRWAALFPGQGSQHSGMGKELFENFKVCKRTFEEASDAIKLDMKKLCFEGPDSELKLTANTQPALLVTSISAWRAFCEESAARPVVALGHSLGEYSALVAAGACSLAEGMDAVRLRGQAMQEAVPAGTGSMMAIMGLTDEQVVKACKDFQIRAQKEAGLKSCIIEAANFNSPGQVVVSGHEKALQFMKDNLRGADYGANRAKMIPLAVSAPFHCSLMKPAQVKMEPRLTSIKWVHDLAFNVIHNVNSEINSNGEKAPGYLLEQIVKPVLWTNSILKTKSLEIEWFAEFGAGRVLSALVSKIRPETESFNLDGLDNFKKTLELFK